MSEAKAYADFGIPDPAPCPSWCDGSTPSPTPGRAAR